MTTLKQSDLTVERDAPPVFIVVMGVSGTGKSTLGRALSDTLNMPFIDGDDLHSASNVAKMAAGIPLDDADREPWLADIRSSAERVTTEQKARPNITQFGVIVGCSALKKSYRDVLRGIRSKVDVDMPPHKLNTRFVFLKGQKEVLLERMETRTGHFMKAAMLESQLDTLEDPEGEDGVVVVSVDHSTDEQVASVLEALTLNLK